jgi:hypothetical protein
MAGTGISFNGSLCDISIVAPWTQRSAGISDLDLLLVRIVRFSCHRHNEFYRASSPAKIGGLEFHR